MVRFSSPKPSIYKSSVMPNAPEVKLIVCPVKLESKTIVSKPIFPLALIIACLKLPTPESLVL